MEVEEDRRKTEKIHAQKRYYKNTRWKKEKDTLRECHTETAQTKVLVIDLWSEGK